MAKPAKSDRQKVIDDVRRKERGADKRRGYAIVAVAVTLGLLIVGAAAYRPAKDAYDSRSLAGRELAEIGAPASACGEIVTKDATGNNDHRPSSEQITYEDSPPAFGPHWNEQNLAPDPIGRRFYEADDRPELESLLHNSEHGYSLLWYDESVAQDDEQMDQIKAIAAKFDADDQNYRLKFKAIPWTAEDGGPFPEGQHVALTHWSVGGIDAAENAPQEGVWRYCSATSGEALADFMLDYPYFDSPEPVSG